MPKSVLGREARFRVSFQGGPYPASRALCSVFNLEYGLTVGNHVLVQMPKLGMERVPFRELYATAPRADKLLELIAQKIPIDLYARVQFAEQDVHRVRGVFFGCSYYDTDDESGDPYERYMPPEGKAILLFSKIAP
ncbi:MAG: hypothetical protein ABI988_11215 [Nitrospirota bacterium]